MSHDFEPEPHEKAMIDVMLKRNTTPEWVYKFNKFLIDERTTGEIIKFIDELLHQELQKARENTLQEVIEIIKSVQVTATKLHDNDATPGVAKVVNDWLMPEVKRNIIKAIQSELDQPTV